MLRVDLETVVVEYCIEYLLNIQDWCVATYFVPLPRFELYVCCKPYFLTYIGLIPFSGVEYHICVEYMRWVSYIYTCVDTCVKSATAAWCWRMRFEELRWEAADSGEIVQWETACMKLVYILACYWWYIIYTGVHRGACTFFVLDLPGGDCVEETGV